MMNPYYLIGGIIVLAVLTAIFGILYLIEILDEKDKEEDVELNHTEETSTRRKL